jgi:peptidoglycan/xylan/chitin deacetylase (PgdA/CDA1 family)
VTLKRRGVLVGLGGAVVGAVGAIGGGGALAAEQERTPLPFYGSAVSAVRPDESYPGAAHSTVVWAGAPSSVKRLALTFDDGPDADWTPRVLGVLEKHGVPATFFVRGDHFRAHGDILRDASGRHEIGNHTWDHHDLGRSTYAQARDQLQRTSDEIEQVMGHRPTLFRPPYGHLAGSSVLAAAELGLTTIMWSAQMHEGRYLSHPDSIVDDIRAQGRPGAIILAHDSGSPDRLITISHLDAILDALHGDGYQLVTVSSLCDLPAGPLVSQVTG